MQKIDFKRPRSMQDAYQRFVVELNCMIVWLRDEAAFHDNQDHAALETASRLCLTLEDVHKEARRLTKKLEERSEDGSSLVLREMASAERFGWVSHKTL